MGGPLPLHAGHLNEKVAQVHQALTWSRRIGESRRRERASNAFMAAQSVRLQGSQLAAGKAEERIRLLSAYV